MSDKDLENTSSEVDIEKSVGEESSEEILLEEEILEIEEIQFDEDFEEEVEEKSSAAPPPLPPPLPVPEKLSAIEEFVIATHEKAYPVCDNSVIEEFSEKISREFEERDHEHYLTYSNRIKDNLIKAIYLNQAGYLSEKTGNLALALKYYAASLDADKSLIPNLRSLRRILKLRGLRDKVSTITSIQINASSEVEEKAVLEYLIGVEKDAVDNPEAAQHFVNSLELNPAYIPSIIALNRMSVITGDANNSSIIMENLASLTGDAELQASLIMYAANKYEVSGNYAAARDLFKKSLLFSSGHHQEIWYRLTKNILENGTFEDYINVLKQRLEWHRDNGEEVPAQSMSLFISWLIERNSGASDAFEFLRDYAGEEQHECILNRLYDLAWANGNWDFLANTADSSVDGYIRLLAKANIGLADDDEYEGDDDESRIIRYFLEDFLIDDTEALEEILPILSDNNLRSFIRLIIDLKKLKTGRMVQFEKDSQCSELPEYSELHYFSSVLEGNDKLAIDILRNSPELTDSSLFYSLELFRLIVQSMSTDENKELLQRSIERIISEEGNNPVMLLLSSVFSDNADLKDSALEKAASIVSTSESLVLRLHRLRKLLSVKKDPQLLSSIIPEFFSDPVLNELAGKLCLLNKWNEQYIDYLNSASDMGSESASIELALREYLKGEKEPEKRIENLTSMEASWWKLIFSMSSGDALHVMENAGIFSSYMELQQDVLYSRASLSIDNSSVSEKVDLLHKAIDANHDSSLVYQMLLESCFNAGISLSVSPPETSPVWVKLWYGTYRLFTDNDSSGEEILKSIAFSNDLYSDIAALILRFVLLRDSRDTESYELIKFTDIDRSVFSSFITTLIAGQIPLEIPGKLFDAVLNPMSALSSDVLEILPDSEGVDEFSSWMSLTKELKGKPQKAIEIRNFNGENRLGMLLSIRRMLSISDEYSLDLYLELADCFPMGTQQRKSSLLEIAEHSQDSANLVAAYFRLYNEFPGNEEFIKNAFSIAMETVDDNSKAVIYSMAKYADIPENDYSRLEEIFTENQLSDEHNWPELLRSDYKFGTGKLPEFDLKNTELTPGYDDLIASDAKLLTELHYEFNNQVWLKEAARLYMALDDFSTAGSLFDETEISSEINSLLRISCAFRGFDFNKVIEISRNLIEKSGFIRTLAGELSFILNEDLDWVDESDYSLKLDIFSRNGDLEMFSSLMEKLEYPAGHYACALMNFIENTDAYSSFLEMVKNSEYSQGIRFHKMVSFPTPENKLLYHEVYPDEYSTLRIIEDGNIPSELPGNPLVLWFALDSGLVTFQAIHEHISDSVLKNRLNVKQILFNIEEQFEQITDRESDFIEKSIFHNLRTENVPLEDLTDYFRIYTASCKNEFVREWFSDPSEYTYSNSLVQAVDMLRVIESGGSVVLDEDFVQEMSAIGTYILDFMQLTEKTKEVSTYTSNWIKLSAFAKQEDKYDLKHSLDEEINSGRYIRELSYFRSMLNMEIDSGYPSVLSSMLGENENFSTSWEGITDLLSQGMSELAATRCMVGSELKSEELESSMVEFLPQNVRFKYLKRYYRKKSDYDEFYRLFQQSDEEYKLSDLLTASMTSETVYKNLKDSTDPFLQFLYEQFAWEFGHFADITGRLLSEIESSESTPENQAKAYRELSWIDEYEKGDVESSLMTRWALLSSGVRDSYNLMLLIDDKRTTGDVDAEIALLDKLIELLWVFIDKIGYIAEKIRLEERVGLPLPQVSFFENIREQIELNGELLWWWQLKAGTDFPVNLEFQWYRDEPVSRMVYGFRLAKQFKDSGVLEDAYEISVDLLNSSPLESEPVLMLTLGISLQMKKWEAIPVIITRLINLGLYEEIVQSELWFMAGLVTEIWGEDYENAVNCYENAINLDPGKQEIFGHICRCCEKTGDFKVLAAAIERQIDYTPNQEIAARLLYDLISVYRDKLDKLPFAVMAVKRYLEINPGDLNVLNDLCELYRSQNNISEEIKVLNQLVTVEKSSDELSRLHRRLGELQETENTNLAISYYMKSLEYSQKNSVFKKLYELYSEIGDFRNAVRSIKRYISLINDKQEKISLTIEAALIFEKRLKDLRNAAAMFASAVDYDSENMDAVKALVEHYNRNNDTMSRNVKLDMLWVNERQKVHGIKSRDAIKRISTLFAYKKDKENASILAEAALSCGVREDELAVKPQKVALDFESLQRIRILYTHPIHDSHLQLFSFISSEAPKYYKDFIKKNSNLSGSRLKNPPSGLKNATNDGFFNEIQTGKVVKPIVLPYENPVLLIPESMADESVTEDIWNFFINPLKVFHAKGLSLPYCLDEESLTALMASMVKFTFPEKDVGEVNENLLMEISRSTSKLFSRMDRSTYASYIIEAGTFNHVTASGILVSLERAANCLGYLSCGSLGVAIESLKLLSGNNTDELIKFLVTSQHFSARAQGKETSSSF
ncbi:MAG: hypothetical protein JXR95_03420 [Deltaproteobacteria bacterium]|nr:hypothetical protein [Deltaproteobacteria bacterium]